LNHFGPTVNASAQVLWLSTVFREKQPCYKPRLGRDSVTGIATRYGVDGTRPDRPGGSPSFLYNVYRVIFVGKAAAEKG